MKDVIIFDMKSLTIKRFLLSSGAILLIICLLIVSTLLVTPARAQVLYFTPTAEANGNIYYVVKDGDTCTAISLTINMPEETLRTLNNLTFDQCRFLQVGQKLLLGTVPTAVITVGPSPTPTSFLPTPEPLKGTGTICIYLYNDINGNAIADPAEITNTGLAGGAISISAQSGGFSSVGTTLNTGEAVCFKEVPEGTYNVSIAIPDGYNPTQAQNFIINLKAGDTSTVDFSAQESGSHASQSNPTKGGNAFLAVIGGIILLAGIGVGLYARYILKTK
jgi:hypothetical protein